MRSDQFLIGFHRTDTTAINSEGFLIVNLEIVSVPLRSADFGFGRFFEANKTRSRCGDNPHKVWHEKKRILRRFYLTEQIFRAPHHVRAFKRGEKL